MLIEIEEHVYPSLNSSGELEFDIGFFEAGPLPIGLLTAIDLWQDDGKEEQVDLKIVFKLSAALDNLIDLNEFGEGGPIDIESKPTFLAMKHEMAGLIARIDTLQFKAAKTSAKTPVTHGSLDTRTGNVLKAEGIEFIEDALAMNDRQLKALTNFGNKSLRYLRDWKKLE